MELGICWAAISTEQVKLSNLLWAPSSQPIGQPLQVANSLPAEAKLRPPAHNVANPLPCQQVSTPAALGLLSKKFRNRQPLPSKFRSLGRCVPEDRSSKRERGQSHQQVPLPCQDLPGTASDNEQPVSGPRDPLIPIATQIHSHQSPGETPTSFLLMDLRRI